MSPRPARRRRRAARWAAAGLALLALACALPVAAIEGGCAVAPDPTLQERAGGGSRFGIAPDGYKRAAGDSYLTFPEWDIVHAYADLAGVTRSASESAFDYWAATTGFWTSLCGATRAAGRTGDVTAGQKVTNYVIGLSFTAEMLIQGAYERTVGALTAWWRGPEPTEEDRFNARLLADYAVFLRQTPWYRYPFDAELSRLWRDVPFTPSLRAVERRGALSLQYGVKWAYAQGIAWLAGMDPAGLTIRSVVAGLDAADAAADPRITRLGPVPAGDGGPAALIETPRYRAFTEILRGLGRAAGPCWRSPATTGSSPPSSCRRAGRSPSPGPSRCSRCRSSPSRAGSASATTPRWSSSSNRSAPSRPRGAGSSMPTITDRRPRRGLPVARRRRRSPGGSA